MLAFEAFSPFRLLMAAPQTKRSPFSRAYKHFYLISSISWLLCWTKSLKLTTTNVPELCIVLCIIVDLWPLYNCIPSSVQRSLSTFSLPPSISLSSLRSSLPPSPFMNEVEYLLQLYSFLYNFVRIRFKIRFKIRTNYSSILFVGILFRGGADQ